MLTLERLHAITAETSILGSETIAKVPGLCQACVSYPASGGGRSSRPRGGSSGAPRARILRAVRPPAVLRRVVVGAQPQRPAGMLTASGFTVIEQHGDALHATLIGLRSD
ncbi:MAG: hypothetical protein ACR2NR_04730 [Solirubrobacteraceae bacterium]